MILANLVLILSFVTSCFGGGETHVHLSKQNPIPADFKIGGTYQNGIYTPAFWKPTYEEFTVSVDYSCVNLPESMINEIFHYKVTGTDATLLIWKDKNCWGDKYEHMSLTNLNRGRAISACNREAQTNCGAQLGAITFAGITTLGAGFIAMKDFWNGACRFCLPQPNEGAIMPTVGKVAKEIYSESLMTGYLKYKDDDSTGSSSNLDEWEFCGSHGQCKSNCCSSIWSDDHKLKCHPNSACSPASTSNSKQNSKQKTSRIRKLDEWEFCSKHSQCKSNCCHNKWSDDKKLKCHDTSACRHKVKRDTVTVPTEVIQKVISKVDPVIIAQYWNGLSDKSSKKPITLSEYGKYLNSFVPLELIGDATTVRKILQEVFEKFDVNQDGKVDSAEPWYIRGYRVVKRHLSEAVKKDKIRLDEFYKEKIPSLKKKVCSFKRENDCREIPHCQWYGNACYNNY